MVSWGVHAQEHLRARYDGWSGADLEKALVRADANGNHIPEATNEYQEPRTHSAASHHLCRCVLALIALPSPARAPCRDMYGFVVQFVSMLLRLQPKYL